MTESRIIVTCAPVALAPNLPAESTYSTYEQVACPQCAGPMWLGAKGKVQVEHGAEMLCMVCVSHLKIAFAGTYLLNPDHTIQAVDDMLEWAKRFEPTRRLAQTHLPYGVRVSTVFLGVDHGFDDGPPILFETMIFNGPYHGEQERYATWDEAMAGHKTAVALASSVPCWRSWLWLVGQLFR